MPVDPRPLLERQARGILVRAYAGIGLCALLGACAFGLPVAHVTRPRV